MKQDGAESVDELLARLEACIARLGNQGAEIEELVKAYEEGVSLLAATETRLEELKLRAGLLESRP